MDSGNAAVRARLAEAQRCAGIPSQTELARRSGVPQATISRLMGGVNAPELETLRKLAAACWVSPVWLATGTDERDAQPALSVAQREWLALLEDLGTDDVAEFTEIIRARQERNRRLMADLARGRGEKPAQGT